MTLEEKMIAKGGIKLLFVKLIKKIQNNFKKKKNNGDQTKIEHKHLLRQ